jgi:hypothetical protein
MNYLLRVASLNNVASKKNPPRDLSEGERVYIGGFGLAFSVDQRLWEV